MAMSAEQSPPALAIFEIVAQLDGALPADLLTALYRASVHRRFVLALHGVSPFAVDALLDPVVRQLPLNIPGLIYENVTNGAAMRRAIDSTDVIFVATPMFQAWAEDLGFEYVHDRSGFPGLKALVRKEVGVPVALMFGVAATFPAATC
jgi:hypothetical protein